MSPATRSIATLLLAGPVLSAAAQEGRRSNLYETVIDGRLAWIEKAGEAEAAIVELESLLSRAIAREAPAPIRQDMAGFGGAWGGHAQIFWRAGPPQQEPTPIYPSLELPLHVAEAGRYNLTLHYTAAPDYGAYNVIIGGELRTQVDGYAPSVTRRSVRMENVPLRKGDNQLIVAVHAKDPSSTNYFVGLDRITLLRHGETPATAMALLLDEVRIGGSAATWGERVSVDGSQVVALGKGSCMTYLDVAIRNPGATASGPATLVARLDAPTPAAVQAQWRSAGWSPQGSPQGTSTAIRELDAFAPGQRRIHTLPLPLRAGRDTRLRMSIAEGNPTEELRIRPTAGCDEFHRRRLAVLLEMDVQLRPDCHRFSPSASDSICSSHR